MFDSWDCMDGHPLSRGFHLECFCAFPPDGLEEFSQIKWNSSPGFKREKEAGRSPAATTEEDKDLVRQLFRKPEGAERKTASEFTGMRVELDYLKSLKTKSKPALIEEQLQRRKE